MVGGRIRRSERPRSAESWDRTSAYRGFHPRALLSELPRHGWRRWESNPQSAACKAGSRSDRRRPREWNRLDSNQHARGFNPPLYLLELQFRIGVMGVEPTCSRLRTEVVNRYDHTPANRPGGNRTHSLPLRRRLHRPVCYRPSEPQVRIELTRASLRGRPPTFGCGVSPHSDSNRAPGFRRPWTIRWWGMDPVGIEPTTIQI